MSAPHTKTLVHTKRVLRVAWHSKRAGRPLFCGTLLRGASYERYTRVAVFFF